MGCEGVFFLPVLTTKRADTHAYTPSSVVYPQLEMTCGGKEGSGVGKSEFLRQDARVRNSLGDARNEALSWSVLVSEVLAFLMLCSLFDVLRLLTPLRIYRGVLKWTSCSV